MEVNMNGLQVRYQQISDAKRFYEILTHPDFILFPVKPKSIEEEKRFLRTTKRLRENNVAYNYTILLRRRVVGAIGIKIDQHRTYIGEIGYFVDRKYWGREIAVNAVKLIEDIGFDELGLERIELITLKQNVSSIRVAEKCGYKKEGIQRHKIKLNGKWEDAYLFAKVKK
jgi:ribosomal-protein-alanine N-acetyltransferase